MGSPVKADDFVALSLSGEACDRFKQLLRNNTLLNQLFGWLLGSGSAANNGPGSFCKATAPTAFALNAASGESFERCCLNVPTIPACS